MKHELFSRVILAEDIPAHGLRQGDPATVVEHDEGAPALEAALLEGVRSPHVPYDSTVPDRIRRNAKAQA